MVFNLSITIPKREEQQPDEPIEELISQLKYLETPECRAVMKEEDRVEKRADVTRQFRHCLAMRKFFRRAPKVIRSTPDEFDFLYD